MQTIKLPDILAEEIKKPDCYALTLKHGIESGYMATLYCENPKYINGPFKPTLQEAINGLAERLME